MFQYLPVRLRVNSVVATDDLFARASNLRDVDAICIDFDRCLENGVVERCFRWIDKSNQFKLQVFLIGTREHLLKYPVLRTKDVTFVEKAGDLSNAPIEAQAEIVNRLLEEMFEPFREESTGYANSVEMFGGKLKFEREVKKTIDPAYFQPVLTDEQDRALLAFLRTPEGREF